MVTLPTVPQDFCCLQPPVLSIALDTRPLACVRVDARVVILYPVLFRGVCFCLSCLSCLQTQPAVLNAQTGEEVTGTEVEGVLAFRRPWPSLARTVHGDHQRYLDVYLRPYKASLPFPLPAPT